jgi:tRNA threonylcarbamoyladenosine biosynthesis protein TsaE
MPLSQTTLFVADEAATARLGAAIAHAIEGERTSIARDGLVIGLSGDLGAGKTSLVRAILRTLGVTGPVKSPTFTLLEPYVVSSLDFYHFDFYRFTDPREFAAAGFRELFGPGSVCAIEWPERAGELPSPDLALTLKVEKHGRRVDIVAHSKLGASCLNKAINRWEETAAAG